MTARDIMRLAAIVTSLTPGLVFRSTVTTPHDWPEKPRAKRKKDRAKVKAARKQRQRK